MVRYLKVTMTGHERNDNGLYCTLSSIQVFGSSMHKVMRDISQDLFPQNGEKQVESIEIPFSDDLLIPKVCESSFPDWKDWPSEARTLKRSQITATSEALSIMESLAGIDKHLNELQLQGGTQPASSMSLPKHFLQD